MIFYLIFKTSIYNQILIDLDVINELTIT